MVLLAQDKSTRDISEILNVSVSTIETHRRKIKIKLNLRTDAGLIHVSRRLTLEQVQAERDA